MLSASAQQGWLSHTRYHDRVKAAALGRELAGGVADLGVLVPIAVGLIMVNGLSATAVLLPAGLLYVVSGWYFRLPIPVQPLKAFGAIAIAGQFGADVIAAGSILMGLIFVPLGASGLLDRVAALVPRPLIRGIQLSVGLIFLRLAWQLISEPPDVFAEAAWAPQVLLIAAAATAAVAMVGRRQGVTLLLVGVAVVLVVVRYPGPLVLGPSALTLSLPGLDDFLLAAAALVLPQLPLTFANSCVATADAARIYFPERAQRVGAGRLAVSLGLANLVAGGVAGMPLCHGAGGLTAHRAFGARSGFGTATLGGVLVILAMLFGHSLAGLLGGFPLWVLASLLTVAGLLHIGLLRDLRGLAAWGVAVAVGVIGFFANLALGLGIGLAWYGFAAIVRRTRFDRPPVRD